jgi:hypothetical protein
VIGTVPKSAKTPAATKFYLVEWDEKDDQGNHILTKEPSNGRFVKTGGCYWIREFWKSRNIIYDHPALHYNELPEFAYLTDEEAAAIEETEARGIPFITDQKL